ncbi:MAG TPA: aminotransferase class I/II-fold pyridoxal phosphate-dependent enzyme [Thermoanaerobaculia bacterium]|jgi:aspartate/methionine/tyrosine aminotransferase|nr:aminotransferase class I/II-fold pyridoxal phosphate-dependent enzyme [Thermoanaerobaculia bacterium]
MRSKAKTLYSPAMPDPAAEINAALERDVPALYQTLSPLGRRAFFPPDIPSQAAEARGTTLNATTGQITDGRGGAVRLPSLAAAFGELPGRDLDQALLYSPIEGLPEVRQRWRQWQRRQVQAEIPSSLPLVTAGLSHALALTADLFGGEGKAVAIPQPFWGNYRQAFAVRTGARVFTGQAYVNGRYNPHAISDALAGVPAGEPAVALLNIPSNPGGYTPDREERQATIDALLTEAERRPLVVICDDAYAGLVFEPEISHESLFWELAGAHPNLVPVKIDGATKEFSFFGGRVGFLTFAVEPDSEAARSLDSKVKMLVRSSVGSPVASSQVILLQALRQEGIAAQVEAVRALLQGRYEALQSALKTVDRRRLTPLPLNSGCFALIELPESLGLDSETVRKHLLAHHDTGLIAIAPRYLRIAHCSVDAAALPELVRRLEAAVAELV